MKDLESALAADDLLQGVTMPVILNGAVTGGHEKKAPLSGKKALAYRVVAEALEGMGKVGGQVLLVDSHWGDISLCDETGAVPLSGPGVLDGSSLVERIYTLKTLSKELPDLASRVEDGLGIPAGKESNNTQIALREIALIPSDKVRVYGMAERASGKLGISGSDKLDDAGSLFDATRTGTVRLDLDGRQLRVTIGPAHWDFRQGDTTKGYLLSSGDSDLQASRNSRVTIQSVSGMTRTISNGDTDYPRWDGSSWLFEAGKPGQRTPTAEAGGARAGRLYVRNLTSSPVTIRILGSGGVPLLDMSWSFAAYEAADDPSGSFLALDDKPIAVSANERLEIIVKNGSRRILPLAEVAKWKQGSWLVELAPEFLAGAGRLWVRNPGPAPVRIWLLGSDGKTLYGDEPWTFDPGEGAAKNKGLRLTYEDKDIIMTGRETLKLEVQDLGTLYDGALDRIATWRRGGWTLDLARAAQ